MNGQARSCGQAPQPCRYGSGHYAGALVTSETEAAISLKPDIDDLVPSETSARHSAGDQTGASSFPKVLRRRLDNFFSEGNISPKADRAMWIKIALGLAVLVGSWIALYALNPVPGSLWPYTC